MSLKINPRTIEPLLFDSAGRPRRAARWALINRHGSPRRFIGRVFFKKSGILRPHFGENMRAFFEGPRMTAWIRQHDTPPESWIAELRATPQRAAQLEVALPLGSDPVELRRRVRSVIDSVGVSITVRLLGGSPEDWASAREDLAQAGIPLCDTSSEPALSGHLAYVSEGAVLRPHGLRLMSDRLAEAKGAVALYSDTAHAEAGQISRSWFKPDFSPVLSRSISLLGPAFVVDLAQTQLAVNASTDWRAFEMSLRREQVVHLPQICYFDEGPAPAVPRAREASRPLSLARDVPKISIIIPTRNRWDLLGPCLASLAQTDWPRARLEIIVIDNGSDDPETCQTLAAMAMRGDITVLRDDGAFNFARLNNRAVEESTGELLVFLNNDTLVRDPLWLRKLANHAMRPEVGAVGAKLLYEDETVQHVGVIVGMPGAAHFFVGQDKDAGGYNDLAVSDREVSAVTGACLAMRRSVFLSVGGFDEALRVAYNDIALCCAALVAGLDNIVVADPLVTHLESQSRGQDATKEQLRLWGQESVIARSAAPEHWRADPYYSPNLDLGAFYQPTAIPRHRFAWQNRRAPARHVLVLWSGSADDKAVAAAVTRQVAELRAIGCKATVGQQAAPAGWSFGWSGLQARPKLGAKVFRTAQAAAAWAVAQDVDAIIAHSPEFYHCGHVLGARLDVHAVVHPEQSPAPEHDPAIDMALLGCTSVHRLSSAQKSDQPETQRRLIREMGLPG